MHPEDLQPDLGWDLTPEPPKPKPGARYRASRKLQAKRLQGIFTPHPGKAAAVEVWQEAVKAKTDTVELFIDTLNRREARKFRAEARKAVGIAQRKAKRTALDKKQREAKRIKRANQLMVSL